MQNLFLFFPELDLVNVLILFSALSVLFLGYITFIKQKDKEYAKLFFLFAFFGFLWCIVKVFSRSVEDPDYLQIYFPILYFTAYITGLIFMSFSYAFVGKKPGILLKTFWFLASVFNTIIIFMPGYMVEIHTEKESGRFFLIMNYGELAWVYVILFALVYLNGYILLLLKFLRSKGKEKKRMAYFIFATSIPPLIGFFASLILPIVEGIHSYDWVGHVSVSFAVIIFFYGMHRLNVFNSKILIAEVTILILWIVSLINIITSQSRVQLYVNLSMFALIILLSVFFIKNLQSEEKKKEKIETLVKKLKRANSYLQKLDKAKTEFLSLATHQLRAPVSSIAGYASMIVDGDFGKYPKTLEDPLNKIVASAKFMADTINDFLNVTRIEMGRIDYKKQTVSCEKIMDEIISILKPKINQKGLKLIIKPCNSCKVKGKHTHLMCVDPHYIKHVFLNLIENSIKYTEKGYIEISGKTDKNYITFKIKDTGIGITKEDLNKIFEKFSRGKNAKDREIYGSGLGLYVVKRIIEDHRGKIWVESEGIGKGTSVYVKLPLGACEKSYKKNKDNT